MKNPIKRNSFILLLCFHPKKRRGESPNRKTISIPKTAGNLDNPIEAVPTERLATFEIEHQHRLRAQPGPRPVFCEPRAGPEKNEVPPPWHCRAHGLYDERALRRLRPDEHRRGERMVLLQRQGGERGRREQSFEHEAVHFVL